MNSQAPKLSKIFLYLVIFSYAVEGLVESTFASAWPAISSALNINIAHVGAAMTIYYIGSSITCIMASGIRKKLGTNYTSILSLAFYIFALLIMIISKNVILVMLAIVIIGCGVGITEVNTDSYVIKAYDAKWDSFLHAFWGVGSLVAPLLVGFSLRYTSSYHLALIMVVVICVITVIFFMWCKRYWVKKKQTLPKEVVDLHSVTEEEKNFKVSFIDLLKIDKVVPALICFFVINGIVRTIAATLATLLVGQKMMMTETASFLFSFYFIAMFVSRMFFGFLTTKFKIRDLMKTCIVLSIIALFLFHIKYDNYYYIVFCLIFIGFSTASLIPLMNYSLKETFDIKYLSIVLGYAEIVGLLGASTLSLSLGVVMTNISMEFTQIFLIFMLFVLLIYFNLYTADEK